MRLLLLFLPALLLAESAPSPPASSELLTNTTANAAYYGVGQFRGTYTCTATLIDPSGLGAATAKAWLLTAGHCISLEPYGVIRNQAFNGQVTFKFFADIPATARVTTRTKSVGWATMKQLDMALVELDATIGDLAAQGIRPLALAATPPAAGRDVHWVGVPLSPIPADQQFLRLGKCTLGPKTPLIEGNWIWDADLSNDCPDMYGGASGSPLFDTETRSITGVISTTTTLNFIEGPDFDCQTNRPCAILPGGPVMQPNTSYAADAEDIAKCFDQTNTLDLARAGCPLDPGYQLTVKSGSNEVQPLLSGKSATWDAALSGTQAYYAYKHFRAGDDTCANPAGYSGPIALSKAPTISDLIGREDGYYFLCVIAGDTPQFDASWQQPVHASTRFKRLDSQPPVVTSDYEIDQLQGFVRLVFSEGTAPNGLGISLEKRGPLGATDCANPDNYRFQISIPDTIRPVDYPTRICIKASDKAGNFAPPDVFDFGPPALLPRALRNGASLERASAAPGSIIRVDGFNLTTTTQFSATPVSQLAGVSLGVIDSTGRKLAVPLTTAGPLYLEGIMPADAAPGPANIVVQPPSGAPLTQSAKLTATAPGIFFDPAIGAAVGFAYDNKSNAYPLPKLPVSSTPGGLTVVLYGAGLRNARDPVRVQIGTYTISALETPEHPTVPGVDEVHFQLPQSFPLRLYQSVQAETADGKSNVLWLYLQ